MKTQSSEASVWPSVDEGHFRVKLERVGSLPNAGLQLPVVSPDGRWIAALAAQDPEAIDPDAILSGRTIGGLSLVLFDVAHPQAQPRPLAAGACWPVWSADSHTLYAVGYDKTGRCSLLVIDAISAKVRRLAVSVDHIITPSLSPSGTMLAFAAFAQVPQQARIYTYGLQSGQLKPLPTPKDMIWQIMPSWVDERALIYLGRTAAETAIFGTSAAGTGRDARLARLTVPLPVVDAIQSQGGICSPYDRVSNRMISFDADARRLTLTYLDDGHSRPLDPSSQAAVWAGPDSGRRVLYATAKELRVESAPGTSRVLANQSLIPIWCSTAGDSALLLAPAGSSWTFDLMRLRLGSADR